MEDIRNAWEIVDSIATRIAKLNTELLPLRSSSTSAKSVKEAVSPPQTPTSQKTPSRIASLGRLSGPKRPSAAPRATSDGVVDEVGNFIHSVAREIGAETTTLTVFMSSPVIQKLAQEFFNDNRRDRCEKPGYTSDSLFWNLQYIEHGDEAEYRWSRGKPNKAGWEESDHLTRFILLTEKSRLRAKNSRWQTRDMSFENKVNFYLCVLRCFAFRARYVQS
ncbi:hypothetical protein SLS62_000398 [Diatrype stigma]|uniref:Uncharacterized protein n=1 Tax=Diatrype stigma TaxID=117547 RepID=A0AAN9YUE8_9PEZI